ncbi:MAG: head-tail adaptor protein [Rhodoferax sp.]|nr:head-tail adaptor protein [Rhodoferax sp.]
MLAPRLRHRIDVLQPVITRDPVNGAVVETHESILGGALLPAEVVPLSGKDYVAAATAQNSVVARITIRERPGIYPNMTIVHLNVRYTIQAILPDPTFARHLSIMVRGGVVDLNTYVEPSANITTEAGPAERLLTEDNAILITE